MRAAFSGPRTIRLTRYYRGNYGGGPAYASISGGGLTKAIKIILIICASVYVLQTLGGRAFQISLITSFGLTPAAVIGRLAVWQLVTYIFLHGGFFHILFNMFALWMFGRELESVWGTREFVKFFFVCGIGAGISSVVASPGSTIPTIGASGSIYGILLAYGLLFPNREMLLIPFMIPVKVKYYVMFIGGMAFLASFSGGSGGGVAHVAHLGGMIFGYLYLRGGLSTRKFREYYDRWKRKRLRRKFEVYYNRRQEQRDGDNDDPGSRWKN
jgi:membrane associated rhomboid family serine protease